MSLTNDPSKKIAIIGAGIGGLAAAYRLTQLDSPPRITVFEASHRAGGALHTIERDGFLIERGADSFLTNVPWAQQLCQNLRFEHQLLSTNQEHRGAYVVRRGCLYRIPMGFQLMGTSRVWPILTTRLLSPAGKLRLAVERFLPPKREPGDESLADFAIRRLGRETYERLVEPLVGGIYTSDARKISAAATLPQFTNMEQNWGNLSRGLSERSKSDGDDSSSGARYGLFVAPRRGMQSLIEAILAQLPDNCLRLNTPVVRIASNDDGRWKIHIAGNERTEDFDGVIAAVPTHQAAEMLETAQSELRMVLKGIEYASSAVVSLGIRRSSIAHPLDAFGLVVPALEKRNIIAASFSSIKFLERAPADTVLIRVFIGGALRPDLVERDDQEIVSLAMGELHDLIGLRGEPILSDLTRWRSAMPQYNIGHIERVEQITRCVRAMPGFELAGNAYEGVGIPHSIHSGEQAADRLAETILNAKTQRLKRS